MWPTSCVRVGASRGTEKSRPRTSAPNGASNGSTTKLMCPPSGPGRQLAPGAMLGARRQGAGHERVGVDVEALEGLVLGPR